MKIFSKYYYFVAIIIISMLVFSCNQLQYKELNSFGGGNYSTTTHKIAQNQKATSNNFELIPNEESEKKILQITPNKPTQMGNENLDNTPKKIEIKM